MAFQTGHFADFEHFNIGSHFFDFKQVKIDPSRLFLLTFVALRLF